MSNLCDKSLSNCSYRVKEGNSTYGSLAQHNDDSNKQIRYETVVGCMHINLSGIKKGKDFFCAKLTLLVLDFASIVI